MKVSRQAFIDDEEHIKDALTFVQRANFQFSEMLRLRSVSVSVRFSRFCAELRDACGRTQVDYHLMRTDQPVERALGIYLSRRQRQR